MLHLRADDPIVVEAARVRAEILQSLSLDVDAKTARIAKSASTPQPGREGIQGKPIRRITVPEPIHDPMGTRREYIAEGSVSEGYDPDASGMDVGSGRVVDHDERPA